MCCVAPSRVSRSSQGLVKKLPLTDSRSVTGFRHHKSVGSSAIFLAPNLSLANVYLGRSQGLGGPFLNPSRQGSGGPTPKRTQQRDSPVSSFSITLRGRGLSYRGGKSWSPCSARWTIGACTESGLVDFSLPHTIPGQICLLH